MIEAVVGKRLTAASSPYRTQRSYRCAPPAKTHHLSIGTVKTDNDL
jgi:hypothetical protein